MTSYSQNNLLLLATHNPGKVRELQALLAEAGIQVVRPAEVGLHFEVDETGATYAENATLKAQAFAQASGLLSVADDSGLEVDALDGAPGVYSARYAGPQASDADRRAKLVAAVRHIPPPRRARFRCVIAVARPAGPVTLFEGICPGEIVLEERGAHGFGYDPIFYLPEHGCTLAELPPAVKNQISHRARAWQAARPWLVQWLAQ